MGLLGTGGAIFWIAIAVIVVAVLGRIGYNWNLMRKARPKPPRWTYNDRERRP